ncbi:alpha/beta hydrolase [Microbacterium sp. X-17]|uniref:alpha/beta hydrolase n=1 Tax=Microbacterium sp. X-17 TaxID=3144404 RepID=UPI0031F49FA9
MPLHPEVEALLAHAAPPDAGAPLDLQSFRAMAKAMTQALGSGPEMAEVTEITLPGPGGEIPVRLYRPVAGATLPVTMYFHSGGWMSGDASTADVLCRMLAQGSGSLVASVEYRLAPEHPFPAALEDADAATRWFAQNAALLQADGTRLAVAGDSSGANLATAVALRARDRGGPAIRFQLLGCPVTDSAHEEHPSYQDFATGYLADAAILDWGWDSYVPDHAQRANPEVSVLRAASLAGLPPALVVTAEFDPLRDEGEAYARALGQAGVDVELIRYAGMVHGFTMLAGLLTVGREAVDHAAQRLGAALA